MPLVPVTPSLTPPVPLQWLPQPTRLKLLWLRKVVDVEGAAVGMRRPGHSSATPDTPATAPTHTTHRASTLVNGLREPTWSQTKGNTCFTNDGEMLNGTSSVNTCLNKVAHPLCCPLSKLHFSEVALYLVGIVMDDQYHYWCIYYH